MFGFDEPFFEPFARLVRFIRGSMEIRRGVPVTIADIGCGPKIRFFHFARRTGIRLQTYYAFDPLLAKETVASLQNNAYLRFEAKPLRNKIALPDNSVDYAVAFAFLEHVDNPETILAEMVRIVKPGGKVIITTPSVVARPVLEFLSYGLHLISKREIDEHKRYFSKKSLMALLTPSRNKAVTATHRYFELYLNNLFVLTKHETV